MCANGGAAFAGDDGAGGGRRAVHCVRQVHVDARDCRCVARGIGARGDKVPVKRVPDLAIRAGALFNPQLKADVEIAGAAGALFGGEGRARAGVEDADRGDDCRGVRGEFARLGARIPTYHASTLDPLPELIAADDAEQGDARRV